MDCGVKRLAVLAVICLGVMQPSRAIAGPLDEKLSDLSAHGSGEAAYHLGMLYHVGLAGLPRDARKALDLFKLAADRGDPLGAYKYGCYFDGQGEGIVESDPKLALKWKLVAAEAGYALAQEDVARHLFAEGDAAGGLRWLETAAAQGSLMSLLALGMLYLGQAPQELQLPAVREDVVKGWAYMLLAARDIPAMRTAHEDEVAKLPTEQQKQVKALVSKWQDKPTRLTESEGIGAAYALAGLPVPKQ